MKSRRDFLKQASSVTAAGLLSRWSLAATPSDSIGDVLPRRRLTRDGTEVTAFCLGGYHLGFTENPKEAEAMIERLTEAR